MPFKPLKVTLERLDRDENQTFELAVGFEIRWNMCSKMDFEMREGVDVIDV